ncbi:MAG: prepilin-type N-terminal cleavage/methylation domain-containing protein [Thermodesulfobacteriota bacterium]|nr:prepilin-type N-terminal cleavage/methylation domain-containing protein [Thermodesulfobacteriota bacterium]
MRRLRDNNSGFTLIEVLIAMVILTVGLLGTAALIIGIINSNKLSNRISTATVLAQDKMEDIKRIGYNNAVSETKASMSSPYDNYEREVTVTSNSPSNGMKTINVTVYWESSKSVSLQTILSK